MRYAEKLRILAVMAMPFPQFVPAAGLRAGCPTVVCPFFGDQPFWGWRVPELGVGSAPIPQKQLTVARLAGALREVTTDPAIRGGARALGEEIRREDGVAEAVVAIERLVTDSRRRESIVRK